MQVFGQEKFDDFKIEAFQTEVNFCEENGKEGADAPSPGTYMNITWQRASGGASCTSLFVKCQKAPGPPLIMGSLFSVYLMAPTRETEL